MASVIEMTFLYDAGYSVVLLRPKNEVKSLTQSAEKGDLYGEMACAKFRDFFSSRSRGPFNTGPFYSNADTSVVLG